MPLSINQLRVLSKSSLFMSSGKWNTDPIIHKQENKCTINIMNAMKLPKDHNQSCTLKYSIISFNYGLDKATLNIFISLTSLNSFHTLGSLRIFKRVVLLKIDKFSLSVNTVSSKLKGRLDNKSIKNHPLNYSHRIVLWSVINLLSSSYYGRNKLTKISKENIRSIDSSTYHIIV